MQQLKKGGLWFILFSLPFIPQSLQELEQLQKSLKPVDWEPESLFGSVNRSVLPPLIGVMMKVPQIKKSLEERRNY